MENPAVSGFSIFNNHAVRHFVTHRQGGVSKAPFHTLNLGLHVNDDREDVLRNRAILAGHLGQPPVSLVFADQVHGNTVAVLDNKLLEAIRSDQGFQIEADAMVTNMQGVCPVVLTADCVPVLFYDPVGKVAGVAHAGWRGTLKHIVSVTVKAMAVHFGSRPGDILAGIGPSIGPCCYEVREEVLEATEKAYGSRDGFIRRNSGGRWHFDLWYANRFELVSAGIQPGNIGEMGKCTKCNDHTFFSSRASGGNTGRSGAGIWLD